MNMRLFSVVFAAVSSLALAACTVTTSSGSGGAGGSGGDGTGGSTSPASSTAGVGGSGGGMGGAGGGGACTTCGEAITLLDVSNICPGQSTDNYTAFNECVCGSAGTMGACATDCDMGSGCVPYAASLPANCEMCITASCKNESDSCANDL